MTRSGSFLFGGLVLNLKLDLNFDLDLGLDLGLHFPVLY